MLRASLAFIVLHWTRNCSRPIIPLCQTLVFRVAFNIWYRLQPLFLRDVGLVCITAGRSSPRNPLDQQTNQSIAPIHKSLISCVG